MGRILRAKGICVHMNLRKARHGAPYV